MEYLFSHTVFSFCGWELLPAAAIVLLTVHIVRRRKRFRREEEALRASIRSYETALGESTGNSAGTMGEGARKEI